MVADERFPSQPPTWNKSNEAHQGHTTVREIHYPGPRIQKKVFRVQQEKEEGQKSSQRVENQMRKYLVLDTEEPSGTRDAKITFGS